MPLPICAKCRRQMQKIKQQPIKDRPISGFESSVWVGDLFECPECETQIITEFGIGLTGGQAEVWLDKAILINL